ncbi:MULTISPECIES: helix-turn-helix domain-containing protein [unclassified Bacillus (in: firmicutes)]|uniref:helix-turn-helix domain-containing protein n=1 Tax=unclassified Bacillus (in: firmicutes) TaxID=185979 RepID=UPI0008EC21F4|nr:MULTISPECIES: helix-turn-helix domain-containing protein [unclassified Bacillus (in: firmicutes)]SFA90992.1 Helix-turn-helix domain-containing protein [Bacillus sp. UNCCL13]SFQ85458.1 Helix-turn-helix domain-containing protein [Bacillus sp. cl95]
MNESKSDLILHPVRMRILQSLINQRLSVQQLKEFLPDVPQATLYRHLKKLSDAEIIHVVDEIPNRGTVEKIYALQADNAVISPNEIANMSSDEHMTLFIKFMANILGEFENYTKQDNYNILEDGVSFRQANIYLTDEEFANVTKEMAGALTKVLYNKPTTERKRRTFATIMIPEPRGD